MQKDFASVQVTESHLDPPFRPFALLHNNKNTSSAMIHVVFAFFLPPPSLISSTPQLTAQEKFLLACWNFPNLPSSFA
eukprot:768523-Hanusia_phi.AAC.6